MNGTEIKPTNVVNGKRKNTSPANHDAKKSKTKRNFEFGNYNQYVHESSYEFLFVSMKYDEIT